MPIDSSLIGKTSTPQTFEVTEQAVQRFMQATEDPALQTDGPIRYAPPTFPTTFRIRVPDVSIDPTKMQLLHGEQQYTYTRRLQIGEQVTCSAQIVDVRQRTGRSGDMTFMIMETTGKDSQQETVFTARSTTIIRIK
jgi:uncharacterized protein YprB with RNaseH-like and TPR domain